MKAKLKQHILTAIAASVLVVGLLSPVLPTTSTVFASAKDEICAGIGKAGGNCSSASGSNSLNHAIKFVINLLSWILGIAAVIMIIVAGIKYVTSGGDPSSVASAKNTLIYAIVGLIVAALAQTIVHYVLGSV